MLDLIDPYSPISWDFDSTCLEKKIHSNDNPHHFEGIYSVPPYIIANHLFEKESDLISPIGDILFWCTVNFLISCKIARIPNNNITIPPTPKFSTKAYEIYSTKVLTFLSAYSYMNQSLTFTQNLPYFGLKYYVVKLHAKNTHPYFLAEFISDFVSIHEDFTEVSVKDWICEELLPYIKGEKSLDTIISAWNSRLL